MKSKEFDAVVIGAGPAGSTVATILAKAGKRVLVLERDHFPRYHIGESLLPASVPLFKRLGVADKIHESSLLKPGAVWFYGKAPVVADFTLYHEENVAFSDTEYAYMVERSLFDQILATNASDSGAEVLFGAQVREIFTGGTGRNVRGVKGEYKGSDFEITGAEIFDCSGQRALIASRFGIRSETDLQRMAVYTQIEGTPRTTKVVHGWFTGELIHDGWIWIIPLASGKVSLGVVCAIERFREAKKSPEQFFDELMLHSPLVQRSFEPGFKRDEEVHVTGNLGYSSRQFSGKGWTLVGDAAFFIDPCYSTGVHMAMYSGALAADTYLQYGHDRLEFLVAKRQYERKMREYEAVATKWVKTFYVATRNQAVKSLAPMMQCPFTLRRFGSFVGGDFDRGHTLIDLVYYGMSALEKVVPIRTNY